MSAILAFWLIASLPIGCLIGAVMRAGDRG